MSQVEGSVKAVLRFEGLSILLLTLYLYHSFNYSWVTFGVFFLLPDVSFAGYLFGKKIGAISYNIAHSLIGTCIVLFLGMSLSLEFFNIAGLIWLAHIGFDRALGYGLKYSEGFGYTHLGKIGKARNA